MVLSRITIHKNKLSKTSLPKIIFEQKIGTLQTVTVRFAKSRHSQLSTFTCFAIAGVSSIGQCAVGGAGAAAVVARGRCHCCRGHGAGRQLAEIAGPTSLALALVEIGADWLTGGVVSAEIVEARIRRLGAERSNEAGPRVH